VKATHLWAAISLIFVSVVLSAQSGSNAAPSTYNELLAEVRGLRADLVKSAQVSGRIQLFSARLSIEEQRLRGLSQQLIEVRDDLAKVTSDRIDIETRIGQIDTSLSRAVPIDPQRDAYEFRNQLMNRLSGLRARESELRAHESDVSTLLTSEERRWSDFNSRLDDLEGSLPPAK
jgi:DNA repair exonuclease SbcCD ATPase subunit